MASSDPDERKRIAKLAALTRWSRERDRVAATQAARLAALGRWERQVDPEGALPRGQRLKMARAAQQAHMVKMARAARAAAIARRAGR